VVVLINEDVNQMQMKQSLCDPRQLIERLRGIDNKVNLALKSLPLLLSTEQLTLATVEESYGLVITNLHDLIRHCQQAVDGG